MWDEQEIRDLINKYLEAYNAQNATALTSLYTYDGTIYSSDAPPARGREAIQVLHESWLEGPPPDKAMTLLDLHCGERLAVCVVEFREAGHHGGTEDRGEKGVGVNVFVKSDEGDWKLELTSLTELQV